MAEIPCIHGLNAAVNPTGRLPVTNLCVFLTFNSGTEKDIKDCCFGAARIAIRAGVISVDQLIKTANALPANTREQARADGINKAAHAP